MRHVILSLLTVLGLSAQVARAEEAQDISSDVDSADQPDARFGERHSRYGQWVFLGCVANEYQCQAIGARQGFRFRSVQQNRAYCGGGYPGGYPGGGYPGGYPGGGYPGGYPGGGYPGGWGGGHHRPGGWGGGYPGGWGGGGHHGPGGWGGGGHHGTGGWGGGGHHGPGGWGGGGHHRPGGWGGGHHRGRIADFAADESFESSDENDRVNEARIHRGGFAGFACFGAR